MPDEQPWATHLWCWHANGCSARIRVDEVCLAAILGPSRDHLASALPVRIRALKRDVSVIATTAATGGSVTYDHRLVDAARGNGVTVVAPG